MYWAGELTHLVNVISAGDEALSLIPVAHLKASCGDTHLKPNIPKGKFEIDPECNGTRFHGLQY